MAAREHDLVVGGLSRTQSASSAGSMSRGGSKGFVLQDSDDIETYSSDAIRNKVILGDTFDVLSKIPGELFDMVFIDPPYFLQLPGKKLRRWTVKTEVEGVEDKWDKFSSFEQYDEFVYRLFREVRRLMKPEATIWAIATYHSIFRIGRIMQDLGFWILNDVIWLKTNPMPNWLQVRFTNATETLIWASRDKASRKYTFNKEYAKGFGAGKVGANVWMLPLCTGSERLKGRDGKKLHPTQKPIELLRRVILTSTNEGDLVLDPLAGTGTTGYVAKACKRDFVMIEKDPIYIRGMEDRFSHPATLNSASH
ncbi:MAG: DNA methyltransferase [Methanomassiliicoccales archaeon]